MSIKQAIEALEVAQDALDISQSLQESAKSNHHPKTLAAYERVSAALAALRSMPAEPYGQVTVVKRPGCQDQHWFYRWPYPPYLDNAAECVTVYATPHTEAVRMSEADEALMRQALTAAEKIKPWAWRAANADQQWDDDCRALDAAIEALRVRIEQATSARLGVKMGDV